MARYVVLRVEDSEKAAKMVSKLGAKDGVDVLGLFGAGTRHCPGKSVCGPDRKYIKSRKWGTTHCSMCKLPVSSSAQQPKNLLNDPDLHPRFVDLTLSVWEPYERPEVKYGMKAIEKMKAQAGVGAVRMQRYWNRKAREERRNKNGR